ncbi:MAG TPA: hypothetical protein VNO32_36265, partial [Candidatus Acidoferrum sp.]|nr:hypothetical protein [Candidatus Acidoferrum sp.]
MGHEPLAATEDPQLLDTTNGPLTVTLLMLTAELPLLASVKVNHAVPVPAGVLPKLYLDGVRVTDACANSETETKTQSREEKSKARFMVAP